MPDICTDKDCPVCKDGTKIRALKEKRSAVPPSEIRYGGKNPTYTHIEYYCDKCGVLFKQLPNT